MIAKYQTKTAYLTTTALFAALVCLATAYLFHIPVGVNGGYIHIGDALIDHFSAGFNDLASFHVTSVLSVVGRWVTVVLMV